MIICEVDDFTQLFHPAPLIMILKIISFYAFVKIISFSFFDVKLPDIVKCRKM